MGTEGCRHIVDAIDLAVRERVPVVGLWHSGGARLAEGVVALDARRPGLRRDGAGLRPGAADLGGARPGGRRRRVRPGADRHRDHERRRPDLRHRPRGGPQRHRRAGRHGAPRRPRAARPPLRRRARDHQGRRRRRSARPASSPRCSAARAGSRPADVGDRRTATSPRCMPAETEPGLRRQAGGQGAARRARRGAARQVGAEHRHHAGPLRRPHGRRHRQQPAAPGRLPRRVQRPRRRPGSCGCATRSACR